MQYISPSREAPNSNLGPRRYSAQLDLSWLPPVSHYNSYTHQHQQVPPNDEQGHNSTNFAPSPSTSLSSSFSLRCTPTATPSNSLVTGAPSALAVSDPYPSPPMSGSPSLPPRSQEASDRMLSGAHAAASSAAYHPLQASASFYPVSMAAAGRTEDLYRTATPMMHQQHSHPQHPHHQTDDMRVHHTHSHASMSVMPLPPPPMSAYQSMANHPGSGTTHNFDRMGFYGRADAYQPYVPHPAAIIPSHQYTPGSHHMMHSMGGSLGQAMYGAPARVATVPGTTDMTAYGSPKPSRKAKGHVASACVPCKKAHLRCDAHRPCARCIMNGKEDCCIDVQHKKRGRPRLRDDRETRFDPRFPSASSSNDAGSMRRPLGPSSYSSSSSTVASGYDTITATNNSTTTLSASAALSAPGSAASHRRNNLSSSFRVLKSQPRESLTPRFPERASTSDASLYGSSAPTLSIATGSTTTPTASSIASASASGPAEPVAYIMLKDLQIAKASSTFHEVIGVASTYGFKLEDILVASDREKLKTLNNEMRGEQERSQPNYLPPILTNQQVDQVIQALGFSADDISRFNMDRQDRWTFQSLSGQQRSHNVRFGLAKQDSMFFIVLQILLPNRFPYPSPSSNATTGYAAGYSAPNVNATASQQTIYGQPTPVSATFDPNRPYSDSSFGPTRQIPGQMNSSGQLISGPSPGISPGLSTYAASPSRPDYAMGPASFHTPRTEMSGEPRTQQSMMSSHAHAQMQVQAQNQAQVQMQQGQIASGYHQLPPIRGQTSNVQSAASDTQSMMGGMDTQWMKDDRNGGRVGIEGLLERPSHLQQQPPSG